MKTILYPFLLFTFCVVCLDAQNRTFILKGDISPRFNNQPMMLFKFNKDSISGVDTTIIKDGSFLFRGEEYLADQALLSTGNFPEEVRSAFLVLDSGNIYIDLRDTADRLASGTPLNNCLLDYSKAMKQIGKSNNKIENDYNEGIITIGKRDSLRWKVVKERLRISADFKKENISNLAGRIIFKKGLNNLSDPYFDEIYALLDDQMKADPDVVAYIRKRNESKALNEERIKSQGVIYKNIELFAEDGIRHWLSEFIGKSKFVLIDFWASWCSPCIQSIPHLKSVNEKYRDKGLETISISIDNTESKWLQMVEQLQMPWRQFRVKDSQKLMSAYHFKGIPYLVVLNEKGIVVATNLRGQNLDDFFKDTLEK